MLSGGGMGLASASALNGLLTVNRNPKDLSYSYSAKPKTTSTSRVSVLIRAMANNSKGVKIEKNPPESKLTQLGVRNWPKWGCEASKFPWTYGEKEICYLLEGKVKVTPTGTGTGSSEAFEIEAGDLVEFPKGMSCTWDVSVAVDKHYKFG